MKKQRGEKIQKTKKIFGTSRSISKPSGKNTGQTQNKRRTDKQTAVQSSKKEKRKPLKSKAETKRENTALKQANTGKRQLRDAKGHFISKDATETILKRILKSKSKKIDYRDYLESKEVKGFLKTMVTHDKINTPSLPAVIDNDKATNKKYIIIDIDGTRHETNSQKEAKIIINQINSKLYDILELIEEEMGEIDSPQFQANVTEKVTQNQSHRLTTIDYSTNKTSPAINPEIWQDYKDKYILLDFEEEYDEEKYFRKFAAKKGEPKEKFLGKYTKKGKKRKI